jgi:hypothetical protein
MTEYKVTPEQWASIEKYSGDCIYDAALLELRARVEELESRLNKQEEYAQEQND